LRDMELHGGARDVFRFCYSDEIAEMT
jgi:hypothetical protein